MKEIAIAFFQTMAVQDKLPSTFIEHFKEHSWFIVVCRYVLGIDTASCFRRFNCVGKVDLIFPANGTLQLK